MRAVAKGGQVLVTTDDGVGLAVDARGSGPGLILVHGLGGAADDFADHVDRLAADHTVVAFDHRGHGASDHPDDPAAYSIERLAADVLAVADATGLGSFRLLGHSLGGMVAQVVVSTAPARVDALVLMDTTHAAPAGMDPELVELGAVLALQDGMAELRRVLDAFLPATPAAQRLADDPAQAERDRRRWEQVSAVAWSALVRDVFAGHDRLPALRAATCPALVIVGEQDEPYLASSRAMADAIPAARLVVLPDAGHSPQREVPEAWLEVVVPFLAGLPVEVGS